MQYEIYDGRPVLTDKDGGSILLEDERWYPFNYFDNGDIDVSDNDEYGFITPSAAFKMAKKIYT